MALKAKVDGFLDWKDSREGKVLANHKTDILLLIVEPFLVPLEVDNNNVGHTASFVLKEIAHNLITPLPPSPIKNILLLKNLIEC